MSDDRILKEPSPHGGFFKPPVNELEALRNLSWHCLLVLDEEYLERGSYPEAWPVLPSYDEARFRERKVTDHLAALVEAMHQINPLSEARRLPARTAMDLYDASRLFRSIVMDLIRRQDPRAEATRGQVRETLEQALAKWPRAYCWYACEVLSVVADAGPVMANLGRATAFATSAQELEQVHQTYTWAVEKIRGRFLGAKVSTQTLMPLVLPTSGRGPAASSEPQFLTRRQGEVLATCTSLGEIFFGSRSQIHGGIRPVLFPLLIGPTGSGKTHVVQVLGQRLSAHLIRVQRSDFVPQGARLKPTVFQICDALVEHERVLLHLDELDKYRTDGGPTPSGEWGAAVFGDVWAAAEGRLPVENYLTDVESVKPAKPKPSLAEMRERVQRRLFIVASGTFQEAWDLAARPRLGFLDSVTQGAEPVSTGDILRSRQISPEIIARFYPPFFLTYPDPGEVGRMFEQCGLTKLATECGYLITAEDRDIRRTGFRGISSLYTTLLLSHHEQGRQRGLLLPSSNNPPPKDIGT